ncbi:precorrin-6y C5,15-methyltransferase (decarboxylating) subunit CbiE [Chitinophaga agri]|uniref:Precorrin-6y C5,15-methyltransferase (Decarboxylating) subunit CbiE n=1 Tax=Chitinophaga agri TaxID=2703787 RepID=A0A6B9Z9I8_9BACT|nr:precorrin-6y C5,15-methyltransferase (decarboxylating) subunit CbiE [Chitinophaga agri]QHS58519.1 precorrin-6y C5,15-methyltransferase (decarboxylating) subunit CbiE [Chitinophaga agri]
MEYIVIGISNHPHSVLPEGAMEIVPHYKVFSGGKRHYELVKEQLPEKHEWIDIRSDMPGLFRQYRARNEDVVIFASGDPLFYGFAATIQKYDPGADMQIYPYFNSIQLLCHQLNFAYAHVVNTSIHGRSWEELDQALIKQSQSIGVLTDGTKTPAAVAARMLEYGFDNYAMYVGEDLEGTAGKIVFSEHIKDMTDYKAHTLNCVLLNKKSPKPASYGIPDNSFHGLEGRPNMITKMPVRMVSLAQLDLSARRTFWDIGFCTGSVSIEARRQYPHLQIVAFEIRPECDALFEQNTRKHSTPGMTKVMGDFFAQDLAALPSPDAVFIGGHGNRLEALMKHLDQYLPAGAKVVINAVREDSITQFTATAAQLQYTLSAPMVITVDSHNPITILTAEKLYNE